MASHPSTPKLGNILPEDIVIGIMESTGKADAAVVADGGTRVIWLGVLGLLQLILGPALLLFFFFALKSDRPWGTWAAAGAAAGYVALKIVLRRARKREERNNAQPASAAEAASFQTSEISNREAALGCLQILLFPVLLLLSFIALKTGWMWLGWTAIAAFVVFAVFKIATLCQAPAATADGIVGGRPHDPKPVPDAVRQHIEKRGILAPDETLVAAVDDSWTDNGTRGTLVTDRRVVAFRGEAIRFELAFADVKSLALRRMWYPGTDYIGRGEIFGEGPVVVLRCTFTLNSGARRRLRFSTFASQLHPLVQALLSRLGDRVHVRRTLPGI